MTFCPLFCHNTKHCVFSTPHYIFHLLLTSFLPLFQLCLLLGPEASATCFRLFMVAHPSSTNFYSSCLLLSNRPSPQFYGSAIGAGLCWAVPLISPAVIYVTVVRWQVGRDWLRLGSHSCQGLVWAITWTSLSTCFSSSKRLPWFPQRASVESVRLLGLRLRSDPMSFLLHLGQNKSRGWPRFKGWENWLLSVGGVAKSYYTWLHE